MESVLNQVLPGKRLAYIDFAANIRRNMGRTSGEGRTGLANKIFNLGEIMWGTTTSVVGGIARS